MSISIKEQSYSSLHFVGIFGVGMSAIAQYIAPDLTVSGSDRAHNSEHTMALQKSLEKCGCLITPQDGSAIPKSCEAIVISTAIEPSNPDYVEAQRRGIPILHRSDVLAALVASNKTISVTGTSGKSTVSSLIFHILTEAGISASYIGGANLHGLTEQGYVGNAYRGSSNILVIEADESDGTVVQYHPEITLILNVSKDHKSEEEVLALMQQASQQSKETIFNGDDPLLSSFQGYTFGFSESDMTISDQHSKGLENHFLLNGTPAIIPFPGKYMAANCAAAVAVALQFDIALSDCCKALRSYKGISRRFDIYTATSGVKIIDDYAHNPEKVAAAIGASKQLGSPITVLFQPHGYGPLRFLLQEFAEAFNRSLSAEDQLILLPVYYAGGTVDRSIDSHSLADEISVPLTAVLDRQEAISVAAERSDDIVLLLGARDPSLPTFAKELSKTL